MNPANPGTSGSKKSDILTRIVGLVLDAGATDFEAEYKDSHAEICAMRGPIGFGIASLRSSSDGAKELMAKLYSLKKKLGRVRVGGVDYTLRVEIFDSFGENAYRVSIRPAKRQVR